MNTSLAWMRSYSQAIQEDDNICRYLKALSIKILGNQCTSSNIIYCISCIKCCKLYIGETGRRLSDRFAEHLRSLRNNDVDKPVARHFNAASHSISDIKVCAISPISGGNDSHKRHEKRLIFKIGTIHPHGLNERFSFI